MNTYRTQLDFRLAWAMRKAGIKTSRELAKRAGLSIHSLVCLRASADRAMWCNVRAVAGALGVSDVWLATGENPPEGYADVVRMPIRIPARNKEGRKERV